MESFLISAIVLAVIFGYQYYKEVQAKKEMEEDRFFAQLMAKDDKNEKGDNNDNDSKTMRTRDLFLETLTKMGCQYTVDEEDECRYYFAYQGENFAVDMSNDRMYVQLWDMFWASVELYDIDKFARLKKVINESNLRFATTTIYTVNEAGSTVDVHCKSVVYFAPSIPDIETYLRTELGDYFHVHQFVNTEMAKLKEQEEATKV